MTVGICQLAAVEPTDAVGVDNGGEELDLPEITEILLITGNETRKIDAKNRNVLTDEGFMVRVSENVTEVNMFYVPSCSGDIKAAHAFICEPIGAGQFQVIFNHKTAVGQIYFLAYSGDIAFKSAEFSIYKEGE